MNQQTFPFQPAATAATTSDIAVTAANQTLVLSPGVGSDGGSMRISNIGTQTIFWAYGTVTANVSTSTPMLANSVETFSLPGGVGAISVIAAAAGSVIYVTVGIGS